MRVVPGVAAAVPRLSKSPAGLIRDAIGGPTEIVQKAGRLGRTIRLYFDRDEIERRFASLEACGFIRKRPNRLQLVIGGLDMLRFLIAPAARDYYTAIGISFSFHQLLRVLDDPVSMIDPTGFFSDRDTIVGHLMQVVHLNPVFDLQLIQMFPDGLGNLEEQVALMVAGRHPRQRTIGAIVEDPGYHARLLEYIRSFRKDPKSPPPVRQEQSLRANTEFVRIERTFATLPGFVNYSCRLPDRAGALLSHLRTGKVYEPGLTPEGAR
jgi:hypothetical protein